MRWFLTRLLEDLAASCLASGASVIGHIKCLLRASDGALAGNLTSVRSGASVGGLPGAPALSVLQGGDNAELEITILVYDVSAQTIDALFDETLARLLSPVQVSCSKHAHFDHV
jgi:hypothetical protein